MYTQTRMILLFCLSITLMGCITQIDPALPHTSLPEIESVLDVDLLLSPSHPQSKINNNAVQSGERVQVVGTDTDGGWFLVHHNNQVGWMHLLHSRNFMGNFKPAMVIDPLTADCSDYLDTSTDMETTWHSTTQGDVIMQGSILYDPTETSFRTAWLSLDIQGVGEVVQSDYVHVPLTHSTTGTTNTTSIILFSFWLKNLNTTSTLAFDLTGVTGPLGSFQVAYFSSHCDYRFGDLDLIFTQQLPIAITKTAFGKVEPITMPAENSIANMLPISTLVNLLQFDQTATQSQHTKEYTKTGETTETPSAVLEIVLNPVQVEDPQLQAFVEGTRLFGEGERLEEADDIEGARQNWLAAVAAYERADEFIYVADLHLRIANSYYPESLRCLAGIATATANATENTTDPLAAFDCLNNLSLVEMMQLQTAMDNNRVQMIIQHNFAALDASTRVYETLIRKGMPDAYDPDVLARADALYRQGQEHFDAGNCQQAEPKLRQARELYQSEEFGSGEARALVLIAVCQYQNQSLFNPLDILDTLTTLLEVYAITATLPLGSPITERYLEANQLFEEKNWQAAQDIYKEVFEHHQATGNTAKMPPVMNQIGNTYVELNQFVEAERWYKDTLAILRTFRANPDPYHQAAVYHNLGAIFLQMGKYHETIPELSQAIELWQKLGQPINEVRSLIGLGTALRIQGDYENALLVLQETQKRYQNIPPDANIESALLLGFAQIAYVQGQYEESLAWIEQAVALQPYLSSDLDKLLTLNFMAVMHTEAGAFDDALSLYAEIIAWAEQTNQPLFVAYTQIYMGTTYARQGSYQEAINAYLQALTFFEEVDLTPPQALIHYQLGVTYLLFNDLEKAEHHFFEALPLFEAMNRIEEIAMIQLGIGAFYINVGDFNQAQDVLEEGLGHWESIDNPAGLSATLSLLALSSLGQHDYEQAIQHSLAALESSEQTGALLQQEVNFLLLTVAYFLAGDESVTAEHIQKIQTNPDTIDNPYLTLLKTSLLAIVHLKNGAPNIAYTYIQEAIEHLEQAQRQLTIPEFKMSEFNGFVDIYKIAMTIALATGQDAQGLYHAEQSMARGFLEQIGNHRIQTNDADDTALIQKEQDLRQEIAGLHAELDNTTMLGATTAITASINLEQAYQAYEDVQVALKLANPEYASLRSVNVSTLSEIKTEILDAETTLILYYVYAQDLSNRHLYHHNIHDPANQIFAWVIEKNHAEFVSLELPHAVLNNDIDQLRQSFLEKESDTDVSAKLYDLLIAPLKPHIQTTNLVIVPHQVLHHLPFAALWNEEDNRYLMEEYAITYAPSASTLKFIQAKRNRNQRRLLALGNPDGSLKAAENEVEAIAALFNTDPFLLDEATETQVHVQAQNVDILHLAAHGKYEDNNPLFTRIELAPDTVSGRDSDSDIEDSSTNDGWLEVHEIFNLNLSDANLVVLSACDTSNATMTRGDDLIGLPRAFIYAGAPAVITTLWPIDDDASAVLMETFYQHWLSGMTTAEALRSAQIDVMATDELASPYYWAAFQLNGDYR